MSAARTASLNIRIEPGAKAEAEEVFGAIGISTADAVNIFFKQVAYRRAIPFELEAPAGPKHLDMTDWSKDELAKELLKGINDIKHGRTYSEEEVFDEILGAAI